MKSENIKNLKKLRLEYKWSQTQLAELSGLSLRTIQRIENGEKPSIESIKALSSLFEIDFYNSDTPEQIEEQDKYFTKIKSFLFKAGIFLINILIICSEASKSAITPSFKGRMVLMFSWVFPCIKFAS